VAPEDTVQQVLASLAEEATEQDRCRPDRTVMAPARFRPLLKHGPLTQAVPYDRTKPPASAREALCYQAKDALPQITLHDGTTQPWEAKLDLLSSRRVPHFVVEVESDGRGRVRFGDGTHGERPVAGREFAARYRVGNGRAGNVGADTLVHLVSGQDGSASASNPLPAVGGVEMETVEEVRQRAPFAFRPQTLPNQLGRPDGRTLSRAVTPADYAALLETNAEVQRAAATFRWTGSWRTVSVTVDRLGGRPVDRAFDDRLLEYLEKYRLAGHDLEIEPPRPVALEIVMLARIKPGYFVSQVRRALLDVFSNRLLPDGRRGVFHPDNLTFGQTIYLSPLYTAAQAVDGVESADITTFQRRDRPGTTARDDGRLVLGRLEIAQLDNDPNFPERGTFSLTLEGGR
jgi:predicted phage baseplate assembly protein